MASLTNSGRAVHATLAATTVDIVTFDPATNPTYADVLNRGTVPIWVRPDAGTPTVGGANCVPVLPNATVRFLLAYTKQVRLIASAACDYSVITSGPGGVVT